jgi:hypothetical protein
VQTVRQAPPHNHDPRTAPQSRSQGGTGALEKAEMSRQFHYYDKGWESEILECPICHWKGKFHQGATCAYG